MQPQRTVFRSVVDELPFPGEKPLIFETLDGLARPETHIAGKNIHQFVLQVFCSWAGFSGEASYRPTNVLSMRAFKSRHGRACPGHPLLCRVEKVRRGCPGQARP